MDIYFCLAGGLSTCWTFDEPAPRLAAQAASECVRELLGICLVTPPENKGGIFGFAEFVQAFALLVIIFTVSGSRYQFRIDTAPIRVWALTYWASGTIGVLTLASDLWFSQRYPMPQFLSSQAYWQTVLGLAFLSVALVWLWFAYVRPPLFGRANAYRFTRAVYRNVLQGIDADLPTIADELERSADSIVEYASAAFEPQHLQGRANKAKPRAEDFACDIMLILGNRKFCKHVAGNAPNIAIALFRAVEKYKQYHVPLSQFASAVSTAALQNKDSLLYHEDAGYYSGYFGYVRPFTNTIYGNFEFVESLSAQGNSPLDIDLDVRLKIDAEQLEAYARAVLTTFKAALGTGQGHRNSYALNRAFSIFESATGDLYRLGESIPAPEKNDIHARLRTVMSFIRDAIDAMEKQGVQKTRLRRHDEPWKWDDDYYDKIAQLIVKTIEHASALKTSESDGWSVQYSSIWSRISSFDRGKTHKIVFFKVRRLLYEEIKSVATHPNFLNARYLGYLLNVLGVREDVKRDRQDGALRKVVISFARKNYLALVERQPFVAEAVLMGTITFDKEKRELVKTYIRGLALVAPTDRLKLLAPKKPRKPRSPAKPSRPPVGSAT
ncbi:hypothetical protein [Bradyrhizobium ottawaense]|uniref:hypothetical protein n=1 Tax=Bradyrhizobium ottawaense TaxID=931866 RepID=UPI003516A563